MKPIIILLLTLLTLSPQLAKSGEKWCVEDDNLRNRFVALNKAAKNNLEKSLYGGGYSKAIEALSNIINAYPDYKLPRVAQVFFSIERRAYLSGDFPYRSKLILLQRGFNYLSSQSPCGNFAKEILKELQYFVIRDNGGVSNSPFGIYFFDQSVFEIMERVPLNLLTPIDELNMNTYVKEILALKNEFDMYRERAFVPKATSVRNIKDYKEPRHYKIYRALIAKVLEFKDAEGEGRNFATFILLASRKRVQLQFIERVRPLSYFLPGDSSRDFSTVYDLFIFNDAFRVRNLEPVSREESLVREALIKLAYPN